MIGHDDPPLDYPCECCHADEPCACCPSQSCDDERERRAGEALALRDRAERGDRSHAALRRVLIELSRPGGISTDAIGVVIFEYFSEEKP